MCVWKVVDFQVDNQLFFQIDFIECIGFGLECLFDLLVVKVVVKVEDIVIVFGLQFCFDFVYFFINGVNFVYIWVVCQYVLEGMFGQVMYFGIQLLFYCLYYRCGQYNIFNGRKMDDQYFYWDKVRFFVLIREICFICLALNRELNMVIFMLWGIGLQLWQLVICSFFIMWILQVFWKWVFFLFI